MQFDLRKISAIVAVGAIVAFAGYSIFLKGNKATIQQLPPPLVRTYKLEAAENRHFQLTGAVHARVESDLGFRVPGKIVKRLVDQGQQVTKGQPLLKLDAADLALAQEAANAAVVAEKAENIRALQDEARQRGLVKSGAVSIGSYELAKALADSTTAKLQTAEATARQADNQVQYATLQSDADGVIIDVPADVGQVVAAGQPVVRLAQTDTREAVVFLPETMTSFAKEAKEAFLYSDSSKRFRANLRELSATADPATRTYEARYTLEGDGQAAPLGSTVTVTFAAPSEGNANTYRIPIGALYDKGNGSSVWVFDETTSTVHTKPVSVIDIGEEFASVSGDLSLGVRIVGLGVHLLKDSQKVRLDNSDMAGQQ